MDKEALDDLRAALAANPEAQPDLVVEVAQALACGGLADEAVRVLEAGVKRLGPIPSLQLKILEVELNAGRYDSALSRLDAMQRSAPRPEPWMEKRASILAQAVDLASTYSGNLDGMGTAGVTAPAGWTFHAIAGDSGDWTTSVIATGAGGGTANATPIASTTTTVKSSTWTNFPAFNPTITTVPNSVGVTTTAPALVTFSSALANNSTVLFRWVDDNAQTQSPDQILGLDNLSIAVPIGQTPVATLTAPENGSVWYLGDTINLTATASDSDGSVTKVEFYQDAIKLGEDTTNPYEYAWTGFAAGDYSLTARATDNDGNVGTSAAVPITVFAGASGTLTRSPYLNSASHNSIVVRWRSSQSIVGRVRYGLAPDALNQFTDESAARTDHDVRLTGLTPYTRYYYSFDYGNIHFICLDSQASVTTVDNPATTGVNEDGPMATWLRADLAGTTATATIAGMVISPDGAYIKPLTGPRDHFGAVYNTAGMSGLKGAEAIDHSAMYVSYNNVGTVNLDVNGNSLTCTFVQSGGATPDNFTITKQGAGDSDGDGMSDAYEIANGLSRYTNDAADGSDSDGLSNFLEFAFGLNPNVNDGGFVEADIPGGILAKRGKPSPWCHASINGTDFRVVYIRRKDAAGTGLVYTPQFSGDLVNWTDSAATPTVLADDGEVEAVSVEYPLFPAAQNGGFFRLGVRTTH
jgi:hypothetical protein